MLWWKLSSLDTPPRREAERTITINKDRVRALLRARHFLAGLLIGAVILLPVFLSMQ
jgi:hypothetical protein